MSARAFQIDPSDNVATLVDEAARGPVTCLGGSASGLEALEPIPRGHKIALRDFSRGEAVVKYGTRIGHTTQPIRRGAWVHLHNLASDLDERSGTLDLHSGAPSDTASAYV